MARKPATKKKTAAKKKGKYEFILTAKRKGALEITLNRPEKLNALNEAMCGEIIDAMASVENDRRILCVILLGNERAFCAGADLSGFSDRPEDRYDNYRARYNARKNRLMFTYVKDYTKPVISVVEGYALGGGFELAMFGDFIVAGEGAQFGLPEGRHSLIPGAGGTQNLPRIIGAALAKEMIWTARRIGADEALGHRIVNHVTPKGKALAKAREIVEQHLRLQFVAQASFQRRLPVGLRYACVPALADWSIGGVFARQCLFGHCRSRYAALLILNYAFIITLSSIRFMA